MSRGHGFLAIPKKDGDPVDFKAGLRHFVSENYDEPLGAYDEVLGRITQWKSAATLAEPHPNGLAAILRYHYQLVRLAEKFPINKQGPIKIEFSWTDSLRGGRKQRSREVYYECACILYNYGSLMSHMGSHVLLDDNGCKEACSFFQGAAGAFAYVKDSLTGKFPGVAQTDLSVECLGALTNLCLAQAQECFLQKAILGKMKEGVLARLAAQASDYYGLVEVAMDSSTMKNVFSKEWVSTVSLKRHYFNAMAAHNHALSLTAGRKFGAAISYWQAAEHQMKQAMKYQKGTSIDVGALADRIAEDLRLNTRDNELIYHELVPNTVEPVARAPMVKAEQPRLDEGEDLLASLKPLAIRRAYARYQEDVKRTVKNECDRLDAQMAAGSACLVECSMPSALDAQTQPQGVPASIIDKANQCLAMGGLAGIRTRIDNMKSHSQNNQELLQEALRMLSEEEAQDDAMRNKHIAEWTRTPSSTLTKELREEARMFRSKLDSAMQADATVRKKFDENYNIIDTLCRPQELAAMLPSGTAVSQSDVVKQLVKELRALLAEYEAARQAVPTLKNMLASIQPGERIETQLLEAATSATDENVVINEAIKTMYGPAQKEVDNNIRLQKQLLESIKAKATEYSRLSSTSDASRKRETVLRNLGIAYDKFMELNQNLQEGQKFYTDLTNRLLKFQQKCSDFCTARKEELEYLRNAQQQQTTAPSRPSQPPSRQPTHSPTPGFWQPGMPVHYDNSAPYPAGMQQGQYAPYPTGPAYPYPPQTQYPQQPCYPSPQQGMPYAQPPQQGYSRPPHDYRQPRPYP